LTARELPELLERLQEGLEGLLSCLEARPLPEARLLEASWSRVHGDFGAVRGRLERLEPEDEERERAQERMEHCVRLHAVASGLLVRRREELVVEHAACSKALQQVRRASPDAGGASCDLVG